MRIDSTRLEDSRTGTPIPALPWASCPFVGFAKAYEGINPLDTLHYGVRLRGENNTFDACPDFTTIPGRYTIWYSKER